jgi:Ca2+-binding RTX toxin-like protein
MKNGKRFRARGSGAGGRLGTRSPVHGEKGRAGRKGVAAAVAALVVASGLPASLMYGTAAQAAPVGAGFQLDRSDLEFILKQIKISERHVATRTPEEPCSTLLGMGENQIPNNGPNGEVLPWGLRTVDGTCNNLLPGQENFGAADQTFPRKVPATFRDAEPIAFDVDGPAGRNVGDATSYQQQGGDVFDSQPRVVSNLIVDQTKSNPAAVAASGLTPEEIAAADPRDTLPIGNVAPDAGLSAPFNSVFTLFGQFFDHGLDLVGKTGGTVYMPLKSDDPLYDDTPGARTNFMVLSRATIDEDHNAVNLTTPFVDQNQTYTSHPSHQVFLREYESGAGTPVPTGRLIESDGGMATWERVKQQSRELLGIELSDADVLNLPMLATDPYGHFVPGANGLPQLVTESGNVEGNLATPVTMPADVVRTGHAFLDDIAHHAVPVGDPDGPQGPQPVGPLAPDTDPGTTDDGDPATYDDEMLNAHFIAGDGRANENIGLTSIHHIFHSEHNRLRDDIDELINAQDQAFIDEWQAANAGSGWGYGERLFQASRFVTEMEYQHLVFEEFARKVQPMVNAFGEGGTGYETVTNSAIAAEFAHAVYRFGHSMLTEDVERRTPGGAANDIKLMDAFLNPPAFQEGGLTADEAAGQVFRGMSRQVGNEIDEFVTEALRNNLLGLPLDLATINLARARDTGIPTLNEARARFYEESNSTQVMPYTSWADFGFNLKHRESLVNFVAAYGQHESITAAESVADKRAAAQALVTPPTVTAEIPEGATPEEIAQLEADAAAQNAATAAAASDFMNATGEWADRETGINLIDLWVGGLAEKQMVAGGLLGPTFNYVFEKQLEDLQFGDRFYYLSRTQGLNLLVQLEGNSFAELVMRNTDVEGLPSDIFSRPDLVFNLPNMGPVGGPITDDATTPDVDEATQENLTWQPGAQGPTIRFSGPEHVVFNGRDDAGDRIHSSEGDDTVRGNGGDDWMQGGDGADNLVGGEGDDIMNDLNGDDVLKGGPGNDAMSSGPGFGGDLNQGGRGKDFIIGGNDVTETFAGAGDDFVFAGDDLDTVFGDAGDDWIEGGFGPFNLLQGDSGQAFQDDPNGGHDVIDGEGGEQDYDAEGGDDIMLAGPGINRSEGMLGFDWVTHKGDPSPANSDMDITGALPPTIDNLKDRFDLVESLSGWKFDDVLRGDDRLEADIANTDPTNDHTLNAAGIARIEGLADLLPAGATSFAAGNIILGGAGSDTIEGRGGDDIIDGDKWLNVLLQAPDLSTPEPDDTKLVDSVKQLQQDVFAGRMNPGDIQIVRRIETTAPEAAFDTAVFSDVEANYDVAQVAPGVYTVSHAGGGVDGTDTLRNIERVQFLDGTRELTDLGNTPAGGDLVINSLSPTEGAELTANASGLVDADGLDPAGVTLTWEAGNDADGWLEVGTGTSFTPTQAEVGKLLRVVARFIDNAGAPEEVVSDVTAAVIDDPNLGNTPDPGGELDRPVGALALNLTADANLRVSTADVTVPAGFGEPDFQWERAQDDRFVPIDGATDPTLRVTDSLRGKRVRVVATFSNGTREESLTSEARTVPRVAPSAPRIRRAESGPRGGWATARVEWREPRSNGGSRLTHFKVQAFQTRRDGSVIRSTTKWVRLSADAEKVTMRLRPGRYRFRVWAFNAIGRSEAAVSDYVRAR